MRAEAAKAPAPRDAPSRRRRRPKPLARALESLARLQQRTPEPDPPELVAAQESSLTERLKCRGVEKRFLNVDLRHLPGWIPPAYQRVVEKMLGLTTKPELVAIGGPRGVGKTAIAAGLVRIFTQADRYALLTTVNGYYNAVADAPWERKEKVRDKYRRVDLLVLDEVQERDRASWKDSEFVELINSRYEKCKATVLLTNLQPDAFADDLGDSVRRRLEEGMGFIPASWGRLEKLRPKEG